MIHPPPRRGGHGGGERQRTARASARAVLRAGGTVATRLLLVLLPALACARARDKTAGGGAIAPSHLDAAVAPSVPRAAVAWTWTQGVWRGRVAGDSTARWVVRPRVDDVATQRLCGFVATGSGMPARLPEGWPVDSALPRLLVRAVEGAELVGLRYVTPGAQARYWFEGVARSGAWRVSLQWPVTSDPTRPIRATATDAEFEAALSPSLRALDTLAAALAWPAAPRWSPGPLLPEAEAEQGAVILARDYPDQTLALSVACPQASVLLPVLARVDQRLRIPVRRGDRVQARGTVLDGAVRLSFDEAPPAPGADPGERALLRTPVPEAVIVAPADGRVTLRVRLLVVPRAQQSAQPVVVTVAVRPPR